MKITPIKTSLFRRDQNLVNFITQHISKLKNKDVLVITSKIVALSEGRWVSKNDISKEDLIKKESEWQIQTELCYLTKRGNDILTNAGIDESNAFEGFVLLPKDSFVSADHIRSQLLKHYTLKHLGIIISDSRLTPLRRGAVGIALGYAGIKGLRSYKGKKDIVGRELKMTGSSVADALATAAVLEMGEGNEQTPLCVITNAPASFTNSIDPNELYIDPRDDMYKPFFDSLPHHGK